jgi:hypothetical protein
LESFFAEMHVNRTCSHSILIDEELLLFSHLLNVHRVSDARQIEVHSAEPFVPNPIPFVVEISIAKIKRYKSPGGDKILAELIQSGGET